jgi:hypothetical protein
MAHYIFSNGTVSVVERMPRSNRRQRSDKPIVLIFVTARPQMTELNAKGNENHDHRAAA